MSRQRAESLLKQEDKEGCFVVRNSSTKGLYTLSLYTKVWVINFFGISWVRLLNALLPILNFSLMVGVTYNVANCNSMEGGCEFQ